MKLNPVSFKGTFSIKTADYNEDTREILSLKNIKRLVPEGTCCRCMQRFVTNKSGNMDVFVETAIWDSKSPDVNIYDVDKKLKLELFEEGIPFEYSLTGKKGTFKKGMIE